MANPYRPVLPKRFLPEVRKALVIIFNLDNTGKPCPESLFPVAQEVIPGLPNSVDPRYDSFKGMLRKVSDQLARFYGKYADAELERWESSDDRTVIEKLIAKRQRHQIQARLSDLCGKRK